MYNFVVKVSTDARNEKGASAAEEAPDTRNWLKNGNIEDHGKRPG